jgi:flagellar FliJ protein
MFQFEMEAVLKYRAQTEEQCQLAFSDAMKRLQVARDVLEDLKKEKNALIRHLVKIQANTLHPDVIQRHFAFIEYLKCKEDKQVAIVCKAEEEANAKREDLLEAVKRRKAMETLREKRMAEYIFEMAAKERKELDDFSIIRFDNGMRE